MREIDIGLCDECKQLDFLNGIYVDIGRRKRVYKRLCNRHAIEEEMKAEIEKEEKELNEIDNTIHTGIIKIDNIDINEKFLTYEEINPLSILQKCDYDFFSKEVSEAIS